MLSKVKTMQNIIFRELLFSPVSLLLPFLLVVVVLLVLCFFLWWEADRVYFLIAPSFLHKRQHSIYVLFCLFSFSLYISWKSLHMGWERSAFFVFSSSSSLDLSLATSSLLKSSPSVFFIYVLCIWSHISFPFFLKISTSLLILPICSWILPTFPIKTLRY